MPQQDVPLPFPLRGVDKSMSHLAGDPDTTVYARNVFPKDVSESRIRGGSRKGLVKRFPDLLRGTPQFLLEVSKITSSFDEPYQFLLVGTTASIYISSATRTTVNGTIQYSEVLNEINGAITDQTGATITDHDTELIETTSFVLTGEGNAYSGNVTVHQGSVIFSQPEETVVDGTGILTNGTLTSSGVADFTLIGADKSQHVVNITVGQTGTLLGSYKMSSIASGSIVFTTSSTGTNGAVSFSVVNAPKTVDVENRTVDVITPTGGTFPSGSTAIITTYRDRLIWAVDRVWYMSRVGDAGDYNYSADVADNGRPVAGTNSDAGLPGDPITAMAAVGYDFLLMFSEQSTWVLRGDPAFGGQLFNLSRKVGCVSPDAWCYGPDGTVFFLSKDGLYTIPPDMSSPPASISDSRMPTDLKQRDSENYDTALAYDMTEDSVVIFVTPRDGITAGSHWWFDTTTQSFWEFQFEDSQKQPVAALSYSGAPTRQRGTTVLCPDGYVRELSGTTDDGDAISSRIVIGPILMSQTMGSEGMLTQLHTELGKGSGSVTVEVYAGDNAEDLLDEAILGTSPDFTRSISEGRSTTIRPRLRGAYSVLVLDSNESWSSESLLATVAQVGRTR